MKIFLQRKRSAEENKSAKRARVDHAYCKPFNNDADLFNDVQEVQPVNAFGAAVAEDSEHVSNIVNAVGAACQIRNFLTMRRKSPCI